MIVTQPVVACQSHRLTLLFAGDEAEVGVDDLHLHAADLHGDPQGAAGLQPQTRVQAGQGGGFDQALGIAGQDRVAVLLLLDPQRGVEMAAHLQPPGDLIGLVDAAAARAPHIHLLQRDNVRLQRGDGRGHAADIQLAVHADAAVDVVGDDARHGLSLAA